jgi:UDP-N-acetylmuramoyl-L-alanyl-D-glutamate--2,6-diaminopimelate ligase
VLELSSEALADRRTSGTRLDVAVLTNIKTGRLDQHNTQAAYQRIKRRIFQHLKPGGLAIVNADDHRCRNLLQRLPHDRLTYALHAEADLSARVVERHGGEQTFFLLWGDQSVPVRTRMIGDQHVSNCLAAAAVGLALRLPLETIARGLEAVERVPGRLERLEHGQPFRTFVDVVATPETLALALRAVRYTTRGRLRVVYGSSAVLSAAQRALIGRVLERGADQPILTGAALGAAGPREALHQVLDGFDRPERAHVLPNRAAAIRYALDAAREGDAVLVAGCAGLADAERALIAQHLAEPRREPALAGRLRIVG